MDVQETRRELRRIREARMYQFRPVSERMKLSMACRERIFHVDSERSLIVTKASKKYESVIPAIKNALIFKAMCEEQTTRVEDHEILVANNTKYFCGTRLDPAGAAAIPMFRLLKTASGKWARTVFITIRTRMRCALS